jgi:hypothetical protein
VLGCVCEIICACYPKFGRSRAKPRALKRHVVSRNFRRVADGLGQMTVSAESIAAISASFAAGRTEIS